MTRGVRGCQALKARETNKMLSASRFTPSRIRYRESSYGYATRISSKSPVYVTTYIRCEVADSLKSERICRVVQLSRSSMYWLIYFLPCCVVLLRYLTVRYCTGRILPGVQYIYIGIITSDNIYFCMVSVQGPKCTILYGIPGWTALGSLCFGWPLFCLAMAPKGSKSARPDGGKGAKAAAAAPPARQSPALQRMRRRPRRQLQQTKSPSQRLPRSPKQ